MEIYEWLMGDLWGIELVPIVEMSRRLDGDHWNFYRTNEEMRYMFKERYSFDRVRQPEAVGEFDK